MQYKTLNWSFQEVAASMENVKLHVEECINFIVDALPLELTSEEIGNRSVKLFLRQFLDSMELDRCLETIKQGQKSALVGKLSIDFLPYVHPSRGVTEASQKWALKIQKYLLEVRPALVFAEGFSGEMSWATLYKNVVDGSIAQSGQPFRATFKEFQRHCRKTQHVGNWWASFVDSRPFPVVGIDKSIVLQLVFLLLFSWNWGEDSFVQFCRTAGQWIDHGFREPFILANAAIELQQRNMNRATMIFGSAHEKPVSGLAERWGIGFEVVRI